jgi:hypothetical protein
MATMAQFGQYPQLQSPPRSSALRRYRLVDREGAPHPVLDDLYESLDAAWGEAVAWWQRFDGASGPIEIGVEVSTASGDWRTLRHPGGA